MQVILPLEWENLVSDPADRMGSGGWLSYNLPFHFIMQINLSTFLTEELKSMMSLQTKR